MRGNKPSFPALARASSPSSESLGNPTPTGFTRLRRFAPVRTGSHLNCGSQGTNPEGFPRFLKLSETFFRVLANHVHSTELDGTRLKPPLRAIRPADHRCLLTALEGFGSFWKFLEAFFLFPWGMSWGVQARLPRGKRGVGEEGGISNACFPSP